MTDSPGDDPRVAEELAKLTDQQRAGYESYLAYWREQNYVANREHHLALIKTLAKDLPRLEAMNELDELRRKLEAAGKQEQTPTRDGRQPPEPIEQTQQRHILTPSHGYQVPLVDLDMVSIQEAAREELRQREQRQQHKNSDHSRGIGDHNADRAVSDASHLSRRQDEDERSTKRQEGLRRGGSDTPPEKAIEAKEQADIKSSWREQMRTLHRTSPEELAEKGRQASSGRSRGGRSR